MKQRLPIILTFALIATCLFGGGAIAQDDLRKLEEQAIRRAVERITPAVVQIETIGGLGLVEGVQTNNGPTTGLVVSSDGYIVSSTINFLQKPASIFVRLASGKRVGAEIVARDNTRKIVLLKADTDVELPLVKTVPRNDLKVGQTSIAVGKIYSWKATNISVGIISATHRIWDRAVQTDAKISPANFGGPLIDLQGRVIGILVPMSPDDTSDVAGAEWYDSGIGFAVPLDELQKRLDKLKQGTDLQAGKLGVALKGSDIYADQAIVSVSRGPAAKAGIVANDKIIEINGRQITRQAQLRHAIGSLYADDELSIKIKRGETEKQFELTLAAKIEPFNAPALGVVLNSNDPPTVSRLNADAQKAGLQFGDQIQMVNDQPIATQSELRQAIAALEIGTSVSVAYLRGAETGTVTIKLGQLNAGPISGGEPSDSGESVATIVDIKVPESKNKCLAIIPNNELPSGVLIWVAEPGEINKKQFEKFWANKCTQHNLALLVPQSADKKQWSPSETEFINKAVELLAKQKNIDRNQIVIAGESAGGGMAALTAFSQRDVYRGLVALNCELPGRLGPVETMPTQPLLLMVGTSPKTEKSKLQEKSFDRLSKTMFPVFIQPGYDGLENWSDAIIQFVKSVNRY